MQDRVSPASSPAGDEAALRCTIDGASGIDELAAAARRIRQLAAARIDAGADVQQTTSLISALNDAVTVAVVHAVARETGADLARACWLAFGSQARGEQTIATDQDNGLVFAGVDGSADRPAWMDFGRRVNDALAVCGYPLCSGRVMAGQPLCCLTPHEWCRRFGHWMAHGSGNDLLAARIYFDLRPLAGDRSLAEPVLALLRSSVASVPRFLKQMADIALCNHVPLNWLGRTLRTRHDGVEVFDLKMNGTALFVDAARLFGLAYAVDDVGTVARLRVAAQRMRVPARELDEWVSGFHELQRLRLQLQRGMAEGADPDQRCFAKWSELDAEQRQTLNSALRAARVVQQRIALDYRR